MVGVGVVAGTIFGCWLTWRLGRDLNRDGSFHTVYSIRFGVLLDPAARGTAGGRR